MQDERVVYQLPPAAHLRERIRDLCGAALAAELLEVPEFDGGGIRVRGLHRQGGREPRPRGSSSSIFLNGRAVENSTLNFALREGYHTALMKGQHPVTFLFIEMDPAAVDVNVHPAKREVRFREPQHVRDALVEAIRRTLESDRGAWTQTFRAEPAPPERTARAELARSFRRRRAGRAAPRLGALRPSRRLRPQPALPLPRRRAAAPVASAAPSTPARSGRHAVSARPAHDFKILGVLGKLYVLMENASGLVLVDQHAAHERILFEEMRRRMEDAGRARRSACSCRSRSQVTPKDADWISRHLELLQRAGIGLEPFGAGTFKIDTLPTFLRGHRSGAAPARHHRRPARNQRADLASCASAKT